MAGPKKDSLNELKGTLDGHPLTEGNLTKDARNLTIAFTAKTFLISGISLINLFNWITPITITMMDKINHIKHHSIAKYPGYG